LRIDEIALRQARDKLQGNALFQNPAILDTLAWSDCRLGDFEKAKELFDFGEGRSIFEPRFWRCASSLWVNRQRDNKLSRIARRNARTNPI
jgi:hypothetical protein